MSAPESTIHGVPAETSVMPAKRIGTRLYRSEMRLIFGRRRNWAGLAVLAVVPIIIAISVKVATRERGFGPDFFRSISGNGLFVALAALTVELPLFLPLAVATIAGDSIAGEANIGTLRYLLTVPVNRTRMLVVKYLSVITFAGLATLLVSAVGMIAGLALFPGGSITLLSGDQIGFWAGVVRVLMATAYLAIGFAALGAIGLFVSTLTEQPVGAMIAVVLLNVAMFILDSIPQLDWLSPWLLTHWWTAFGDLLREPIAWDNVQRGLLTSLGYALVFWCCAWARFAGKDITS